MTISRNVVAGNTFMLLLKLLSEKDMYGYEMIAVLGKRSDNVFELKMGTLYPLLHSLARSGYLDCYDREVNGKLRKYYQITASGRKYFERMVEEWRTCASAVDVMIGGV
ncbi:MAG: PadR family transcriptional regulator [Dorea sp.]|jgi:PadR family transcriptional regulator PadR|nr:PadR family transcriptional regulator [Dorea sp.]